MRIAMRSALSRAVLGGAACVGLLLAPAPGRAAGQDEKALPANTFIYFKIDNAAKLRKEFSASQFGRMIADPAMDPLKLDIRGQARGGPSNKLKETAGVGLGEELLSLPQRAITIAMVAREPEPRQARRRLADLGRRGRQRREGEFRPLEGHQGGRGEAESPRSRPRPSRG